jgi:uncharacterized protein (DUF58 family)
MIPKEILKKVRRIELRTRQVVNTVLSGEYHSAFKGQGVEFAEVREYNPGDDIRSIDWNVTARMGHPFVKIFEEERELSVMLMVDASSSGEFGSSEQTKSEIAVEVCALLAFSAIRNNDRVGLIVFTDRIEKFIPPKKGRKHVLRVVRELLTQFDGTDDDQDGAEAESRSDRRPHPVLAGFGTVASLLATVALLTWLGAEEAVASWPLSLTIGALGLAAAAASSWAGLRNTAPRIGRGTDIAQALDFLNRVTTRRGIVFLVSDFQAEGFEQPLRIARRKHDLVAIRVTDARERTLSRAGLISLEDPESGDSIVVDTSDPTFRRKFEREAVAVDGVRDRIFRMCGVDTIDVSTDSSYVDPLIRFFTRRANRN